MAQKLRKEERRDQTAEQLRILEEGIMADVDTDMEDVAIGQGNEATTQDDDQENGQSKKKRPEPVVTLEDFEVGEGGPNTERNILMDLAAKAGKAARRLFVS